MHMCYFCILRASCGSSQCCIMHDLQLMVMLAEDARSDHMEEAYSRAGVMNVL